MDKKGFAWPWEDATSWIRTLLSSSVARNAASLYAIQFTNYILPLITVPYLVRVLGPDKFGAVAFGQSLIAYFILFVDYGFALSATRKISVERNNPMMVNRIAFNVWSAKALLCIVGFAVLLLVITIVPKLNDVSILLIILYGQALGNVLFPTWLFQGMEKMVAISVINLFVRLFFVIGIFAMVNQPEDYLIYAGLTSLSSIVAGIIGVWTAFSMFNLRLTLPSLQGIWQELVEGWMLFLSMASVSLYTVGNAFILGLLTNHTVVGYYAAAEKIVLAISGLLGPISQAAYPRFSKLASESKILALQLARKLMFFMGGIGLILSLGVIGSAPYLTKIVLGPEYGPSIMVMRLLAFWIFINGVTNVWGIQIMIPFKYDKAFFAILLLAGLINVSLAIFLVPLWDEKGMALAVISACIFVTIMQPIYLWLKGINILTGRKNGSSTFSMVN